MPSIGLSIYSLRVLRFRGEDAELHNLKDGKSLFDFAKEFIENNMENYVDEEGNENIFAFSDWDIRTIIDQNSNKLYTLLYGRIKSGSYGSEGELVDKETGKVTHKITSKEAPVLPFSFCISVADCEKDDGVTTAIAIFQNIGGNGVKTIFEEHFKAFLKKQDIGLTLSLGALYPKEFIKAYMREGKLAKINMIQYAIPDDIADRVGMNRGVKRAKQILTIMNAVGFLSRNEYKIHECMQGKRAYDKIIEFPDFDYDDLKFVFSIAGKNRTVSMKNIDKTVVVKDITEIVSKIGGNPEKESIIVLFEEYSREYLSDMGLITLQENMEYKMMVKENNSNKEVKANETIIEGGE